MLLLQNLKVFGNFLSVSLVFDKILNLLGQFNDFGQILIRIKQPIFEKISSFLVTQIFSAYTPTHPTNTYSLIHLAHPQVHTHSYTPSQVHAHSYTPSQVHTLIGTHTHRYTPLQVHTLIGTHPQVHTLIGTHPPPISCVLRISYSFLQKVVPKRCAVARWWQFTSLG